MAALLYWYFRVRKTSGKSIGLRGRLGGFVESIRNSYKAKARVNKQNREPF